jgi:ketosteroid isomerase-like protein
MISRAARRRERQRPAMAKPRTPTIFTSPHDAAMAFYHAFEARDIDAMMAAWAEDEDIVCVHPGGPRLVGYEAVRTGWEQLFAGDSKLSFKLDEIVVIETVGLALQSAVEHVTLGNDPKPRGVAIATNVFLRTPSGWRMVVHHSSPAPAIAVVPPAGPLH